jgi:hypothetical protein
LLPEDFLALESYIKKCYPDMDDTSVHAIAASDLMTEVSEPMAVLRKFNTSNHSRSDFINVVLYAILQDALDRHITHIKGIPVIKYSQESCKEEPLCSNSGTQESDLHRVAVRTTTLCENLPSRENRRRI